MQWSRREFMVASTLAVVGESVRSPLFAQQPAPAAPPVVPQFADLRGNVGTFTARGGTIGWWVTPQAVVVIDAQFEDTAQMFLDGLKSRTQRKIDLLINTHHHRDHTTGNRILRPSVVKIVGHVNQPGLQKKQAMDAKNEELQVYADETFADTWKVDLGGETISAKHYGPGHTGGDIVIFFERANVVHVGDLMSHIRHPRVDRPGGASIRNWISALEKITAEHSADTIYIYGHSKVGSPVSGGRADLLALRDYFTALMGHVQKQIAAGRPVEEIQKAGLPGFTDFEGTANDNLRVAYEELTAKT
jgi:glyoxylase-like metal-dependent hydrolase (beta-lactamase superfamily II)